MAILGVLLILFGMVPVLGALAYWPTVKLLGYSKNKDYEFQSCDETYYIPDNVPWKRIGGSGIRLVSGVSDLLTGTKEPQFTTLHCKSHQLGKARWRLATEFEIRNPKTNHEIVIDDIHARLYEWNAFAPPLLTVSH